MKQGTAPTRKEKMLLQENGKRPESWLRLRDEGSHLVFKSRMSDRTIRLQKNWA